MNSSHQSELAVIIPVRDEAPTLPALLARLRAVESVALEIVVVDDGSTDASAACAGAAGCRVVRHERPRGYGAALKSGLAATAAANVAIIDADGTYDPADLRALLRAQPRGGMAVGVRDREPSPLRRAVKALFGMQIRAATGLHAPDVNSGLRVFDRRLAHQLASVLPDRFSFTTTLTLGAFALAVPVSFVSVSYRARSAGCSKFGWLDALLFARTIARGCRWIRAQRVGPERPALPFATRAAECPP